MVRMRSRPATNQRLWPLTQVKDRLRHILLENIANERSGQLIERSGLATLATNRYPLLRSHARTLAGPRPNPHPHARRNSNPRMLMRNTLSMLAELGVDGPSVYEEDFEQYFLETTRDFYR